MSIQLDRGDLAPAARRGVRLPWWPLVAVTLANYAWQLPYAVHQYGGRWVSLPGLSIPLVLTLLWFLAGMWLARRSRVGLLAAFLVTEVGFYLVHNLSGAFLADLPAGNPVVLVASLLGYLSTGVAVVYLVSLRRRRRDRTSHA